MIKIDRRDFIASLGGAAAVALMSHEARADAIEHYMEDRLYAQAEGTATGGSAAAAFPTAAEVHAAIPTRHYRRGAGGLFVATQPGQNVVFLAEMSAKPTLLEFFEKRFMRTSNHCLQSANKALERGVQEEVILACLLHDTIQELMKTDHGYWGAAMYEPYVPPMTSWAIRYHQALRFFQTKLLVTTTQIFTIACTAWIMCRPHTFKLPKLLQKGTSGITQPVK